MVKIKRVFELVDDLQTMFLANEVYKTSDPDYYEIYAKEVVIDTLAETAFILRAHTFYEIIIEHISDSSMFVLDERLSRMGVIYNYYPKTQRVFLYNGTENHIYIEKDMHIGGTYDR